MSSSTESLVSGQEKCLGDGSTGTMSDPKVRVRHAFGRVGSVQTTVWTMSDPMSKTDGSGDR